MLDRKETTIISRVRKKKGCRFQEPLYRVHIAGEGEKELTESELVHRVNALELSLTNGAAIRSYRGKNTIRCTTTVEKKIDPNGTEFASFATKEEFYKGRYGVKKRRN